MVRNPQGEFWDEVKHLQHEGFVEIDASKYQISLTEEGVELAEKIPKE